MSSLTFQAIGPGRRTGEWMAGYMRPSQRGVFVLLVTGIPNERAATLEAQRLAREAELRELPEYAPDQFRIVGHGALVAK